MNNSLILFLVLSLFSGSVFAGSNGSVTSIFGIGTIQNKATPAMNGIGGSGSALSGSSYFNSMNPAQWVYSRNTHLISGFTYQGLTQSTSSTSSFSGNIDFNGLLFIIPVKTDWSFGISLSPYSITGYEINTTGDYTQEQYVGSGGLSQFGIGTGYRVSPDMSVGGTFSFYFGNIKKGRTVTYNSTAQSIEKVTSNKLSGVGLSFTGLSLINKNLFTADDRLMASVILDLPFSLSGNSEIENFTDQIDDTILTKKSITLTLPVSLRLGLGYERNRQFSAALDLVYSRTSGLEYSNLQNDPAGDILTLMMGVAYLPDNNTGARYLERIQYKAGYFIGKNHIILSGKTQDETGFTAGLGLPLPGVKSILDLSGGVTWKGYLNDTSIKETQYSFSLGINLTELWFQKRIID